MLSAREEQGRRACSEGASRGRCAAAGWPARRRRCRRVLLSVAANLHRCRSTRQKHPPPVLTTKCAPMAAARRAMALAVCVWLWAPRRPQSPTCKFCSCRAIAAGLKQGHARVCEAPSRRCKWTVNQANPRNIPEQASHHIRRPLTTKKRGQAASGGAQAQPHRQPRAHRDGITVPCNAAAAVTTSTSEAHRRRPAGEGGGGSQGHQGLRAPAPLCSSGG